MSPADLIRAAIRTIACATALQCASIGFRAGAAAQQPFYTGRTIKFIVGFPPGGGYDVYVRAISRYMPRHIPGNPAMVASNMPGAGSLNLANYMYNIAPRDGTEIGSPATFIPFEAIFKGNGVHFDPRKFSWIGSADAEMTGCSVYYTSKIHSLGDLLTMPATFGATGSDTPPVVEPRVLNAVLGTKIKLVVGYPGAADVFLAMERGEVEGACGFGWSAVMSTRSDWVTSGKLRFIAQDDVVRNPNLPDVPLMLDFAKTRRQRDLFRLLAAPHRIDRPYIGPPGMPADRLATLRQAFDTTMKDPDFLAYAKKLKIGINPVTGKEDEAVFKEIANMDPSLIGEMIKARSEPAPAK